MSLSVRRTMIAGAAILPMLALLAGAAAQQQPAERERQVKPGMDQVQDHHLIKFLKTDTESTIALAKLAQQQSRSRPVQEFAEKMIEDHTQFLNQLQQISPERERPGVQPQRERPGVQPQQRERRGVEQREQNNDQQGAEAQPRRPQQRDIGSLIEEVGKQRQQLAQRELREMEGQLFDVSYLGTELVNHLQTVASLQVFRNYAESRELQELIQKNTQTQQQHYQQAKQLYTQALGGEQQQRPRDN